MILNSESVQLIRTNAARLSQCVRTKDDLTELATAGSLEQVYSAIETLLTNTDMYFDDELLAQISDENWKSFKAVLLVYSLNSINKVTMNSRDSNYRNQDSNRDFMGASSHP